MLPDTPKGAAGCVTVCGRVPGHEGCDGVSSSVSGCLVVCQGVQGCVRVCRGAACVQTGSGKPMVAHCSGPRESMSRRNIVRGGRGGAIGKKGDRNGFQELLRSSVIPSQWS